jgi:hypothetical protein
VTRAQATTGGVAGSHGWLVVASVPRLAAGKSYVGCIKRRTPRGAAMTSVVSRY